MQWNEFLVRYSKSFRKKPIDASLCTRRFHLLVQQVSVYELIIPAQFVHVLLEIFIFKHRRKSIAQDFCPIGRDPRRHCKRPSLHRVHRF